MIVACATFAIDCRQRYFPRRGVLAAKLQASPTTSHWAVIKCRDSGNRIRRDVIGRSALGRFDRDVLARAGVQWLVLFEGINDVTFSALPDAPAAQRTTADELIAALEQLVDRAHARHQGHGRYTDADKRIMAAQRRDRGDASGPSTRGFERRVSSMP
jgi:lysophospholipase L1-like esterase